MLPIRLNIKIPACMCWDFGIYVLVRISRISGTNKIRKGGSGSKNFLALVKEIFIVIFCGEFLVKEWNT